MSNELLAITPTGSTIYAILLNATGQVYNGSTFETPQDANWMTYAISMVEADTTGIYRVSMPAVAAGVYSFSVYRQESEGGPASDDVLLGIGEIRWTGTAPETIPASANVTYLAGSATSVDNLVLALQHADGVVAHPQGIADALKLAPTAGDSAAGSVNKNLDDILEDTGTTLPAQIAGLTVFVDPQAMADAMALATTEMPAADSVLDRLATIQAITDELDVSAVTVTTTNNAGELTIKRSASFAATVSGLAIPPDWLAMIWTLKGAASDDDDDAVLQVRATNPSAPTDGLQYIEGDAPGGSLSASSGSVTVNQAGGSVALALKAAATAALTARGDAVWDLRVLRPPAGEADELTSGTADIVYTVTHART